MKKKIYSTKEKRKIGAIDFCSVKALLLFAVFFAITVGAQGQSHDQVSTNAKLQVEDLSNLSSGIYYLNVISNNKILYKTMLVKTE